MAIKISNNTIIDDSRNIIDASSVGIGTTNPQTKLEINGVLGFSTYLSNYGVANNILIGDKETGLSLTPDINAFGAKNIFIGPGAGKSTTTGYYNNFFGYQAGYANTTGYYNNFFGYQAGYKNTTGRHNNFFGYYAGYDNTDGSYNVGLGEYALENNTTGRGNIAFGYDSGGSNLTGTYNNFFGPSAGRNNTTGSFNNFIGHYSGLSTSASHKVILGSGKYPGTYYFDSPDTTKDNQLAIGINTTGTSQYWIVGNENFNVGIGTTNPQTKLQVSNGSIRIGNISDYDTGFSGIGLAYTQLPGTTNFKPKSFTGTRITTSSGVGTITSISNVLLGQVGIVSTVPIGNDNDDGYWTVTVPFNIQFTGITTNKVYVGANSYITFTGGFEDYSGLNFSYPALPKIMISAGDRYGQRIYTNTIGTTPNRTYWVRYEGSAYYDNYGAGSPNMIWEATFYENSPSQIDIQVGKNAAYIEIDNSQTKLQLDGPIGFTYGNILIGDKNTGANLRPETISDGDYYVDGTNNIFLGIGAGNSTTTGNDNFFVGTRAGYANTSGSFNNFIGYEAGTNNISGNNNNFFGFATGLRNTTGSNNNFFGIFAGNYNTTGGYNNFFGYTAGVINTEGCNNNFLGCRAGYRNTTGINNNFLGANAGYNNTVGNNNNFFGNGAGCSNTIGNRNIFIGYEAGTNNTSGSTNNFFGRCAGYCNITGDRNNFLGSFNGISASASYKVVLGSGSYNSLFDTPDTTKDIQFAVGVRTDANPSKYWLVGDETFNIGIGIANPQNKLHVNGGIRNTTRNAASTQTALHINTTTGDIAETASSRRFKRNIKDYNKGLETLIQLRPVSFQFLEDDLPNTGLIAEEVHKVGLPEFIRYDENNKPYSIPYDNLSALYINAIKDLKKENDLLRQQLEELTVRLDAAGI